MKNKDQSDISFPEAFKRTMENIFPLLSEQMAFLQLALPALRALAGERDRGLPVMHAVMGEQVRGQRDWTQFIQGTLEKNSDPVAFFPLRMPSRLRMLAQSQAIVSLPEGEERIDKGTVVTIQLL